MKKILPFLLIICSSLTSRSVLAQNNHAQLDSLYTIWQDSKEPDSIRGEAYGKYILNGFLKGQPDTAIIMAQELNNFSSHNKDQKSLAGSFNILAKANFIKGNYSEALAYAQNDLQIDKKNGDNKAIGAALNIIGNIYWKQDENGKALDYYQQALVIAQEMSDKRGISAEMNNIGLIYCNANNLQKGLEYFIKSAKIKEVIGDKRGVGSSYNNIGNVYLFQKQYTQALTYFHKSLKIAQESGDSKGVAHTLNNIGLVYQHQGDPQKALTYFQKSFVEADHAGYREGKYKSLIYMGNSYLALGNYNLAAKNCKESLDGAEKIHSLTTQSDACGCLYKTYKSAGKWKDALQYFNQGITIKDSMKQFETSKKLQKFEFDQKILRDSIQQVNEKRKMEAAYQAEIRKKDNTRNVAIGSGIFVLLLAGGLWSRLRYTNRAKKVIEAERDRSESLLLNILPAEIAEELKEKGAADAKDYAEVTILFTDFKEFTQTSEKMEAAELVSEINECFKAFDGICEKYNVEKIKTIGDSYMAAGGLPIPAEDSVKNTVLAGLEMAGFITNRKAEREAAGQIPFQMRVGIHTGPVVAGIVGVKKFQYDIWGDTVNTASRMESAGEVGKVNISQDTYEMIKDAPDRDGTGPLFRFEARGKVEAKGKGEVEMYFVQR